MIKYKADTIFNQILQVEIDKETDKSVWINGRRTSKISNYESYHNTFQEAKDYIIERQTKRYHRAKENLNSEYLTLQQIKKLTED